MPLPRMTTRRWMMAVAVVGLLLGAIVGGRRLKQRRDYYLQLANDEARSEIYIRRMVAWVGSHSPVTVVGQTLTVAEAVTEYDKVAAYYAERKEMYLHAASRPWISVPPPERRGFLLPLMRVGSDPTVVIEKDR
jgi:hypothetical protein